MLTDHHDPPPRAYEEHSSLFDRIKIGISDRISVPAPFQAVDWNNLISFRKMMKKAGLLLDTAELAEMPARVLAVILGATHLDLITGNLALAFISCWLIWNVLIVRVNRHLPLSWWKGQIEAMLERLLMWGQLLWPPSR